MTPDKGPNVPDPVRSALHSRHPGIADEIRGAINTLRKLQELAAPPPNGGSAVDSSVTSDGSLSAPSGGEAGLRTSADDIPEAAPRQAPLLSANDSFGRYQIVRLLGRGAMGAVYLAYDAQLQRHVALKTPSLGGSAHAVARFMREARAAAQLRSPYICPVYDVGQIGGIQYLSMAFIDGRPLSKVIAEGQMRDAQAVSTLIQKIARGLQKAHEQGIIHRDLKPDNIMVDADGEPIVMDFGLARRLDDDVRLTTPGRLLGTPAYMSPEQVDGDPARIGPATDIYSLGVVLFEMLTGRLPFQGSLTSILRQISSSEPPKPSSINPALSAVQPLERVCLRMMARSAADRYPDMAAVVAALEEACAGERCATNGAPSVVARFCSWAAGLFVAKPRANAATATPAASAPAAAKVVPDKTLVGSGSVEPGKDRPAASADKTIDLPQSSGATAGGPPGASPNLPSTDQTIDLPMSHDAESQPPASPSCADFTLNMAPAKAPAKKPQPSADQTLDLPLSHGS
jgi:predicted Ser/Thr protein kinase